MSNLDKAIEQLSYIEIASLRFRTGADNLIECAGNVGELFENMNLSDRSAIESLISEKLSIKLMSLGIRMAENAINTGKVSWIKYAVIMHLLGGFKYDYRDNVRYLVPVRYAGSIMGVNCSELIDGLSHLSNSQVISDLSSAFNCDVDETVLARFSLKLAKVDGVVHFVHC